MVTTIIVINLAEPETEAEEERMYKIQTFFCRNRQNEIYVSRSATAFYFHKMILFVFEGNKTKTIAYV